MLDVEVKIKLSEVVGKSGTWFPCLYAVDSSKEEDSYKEITKLEDLTDYDEGDDIYKAVAKILMQDNKPNKIGILVQKEFSTESLASYLGKGWRQLVLVGTHTNTATIAQFIETTDKMLFVGNTDTSALATLYNSVKGYDRTFIVHHTDATAVCAVVGATAGLDAGSFTYKNIKVKGITPLDWTATELEGIHAKGAITIVEKAGDVVTSEGIVASGKYADIVDSIDYVTQNIAYKTQKVFNNSDKIPYSNNGISQLEIATVEALKDAYNNGIIADTDDGEPAYETSFALRSETTENDRATRTYPYGQFSFVLAGAIHKVKVNGTVTY